MICRVDLHVHTNASDDGLSSLEEQAAAAKAAGLHAMAVTDHNQCTPVPQALHSVLLIPGCEVSTQVGHILGLFLQAPLDLDALRKEGLPTAEAACAEIHRKGGLAILAHPYQKPGAQPKLCPVDGVEGANARAAFKVTDANEKALALAKAWNLPATGGSDGHSRHEVGNACTEVECTDLTLDAIRAAIAAGACRPVLVRNTPHFRKGLSQLGKARRSGSPARVAKGFVYLGYCAARDLFRR